MKITTIYHTNESLEILHIEKTTKILGIIIKREFILCDSDTLKKVFTHKSLLPAFKDIMCLGCKSIESELSKKIKKLR